MNAPERLRPLLCESWCAALRVDQDGENVRLSLPLTDPDGDQTTVWLQPTLGGWRITDAGTTMMRLSYEGDIEAILAGNRGRVIDRIVGEEGVQLVNGELVSEVAERQLGDRLLAFGRAMNRVGDVGMWSRARVAAVFYEDLRQRLVNIAGEEHVHPDYIVPGLPQADDYPIDFQVDSSGEPFFVFGVPSRDKARLATIVLQHLQQSSISHNSLIVFDNINQIPTADMRRLMNAANDMLDSLDAVDSLERKVRHRIGGASARVSQ